MNDSIQPPQAPKPVLTALLGRDHFADWIEAVTEHLLNGQVSIRSIQFSSSAELLKLAEETPFDLVFCYVGNIPQWEGQGTVWSRAAQVLGGLKAKYGKPILATMGNDLRREFVGTGVTFILMPFELEELLNALHDALHACLKVRQHLVPKGNYFPQASTTETSNSP